MHDADDVRNCQQINHQADKMDTIEKFIAQMPKAELHVHLEGSVRPQTLLKLAQRHHAPLPADTIEGLKKWYTFQDFGHFIEIYMTISGCLRTADDIELIAREFLENQAEQNIVYSEVTFTPYNQFLANRLGFQDQLAAVNRARAWGEKELGVRMGIIVDIPRSIKPAEGEIIADWVIEGHAAGVIALGLGGPEKGNPPEKFQTAFDRVRSAGIPCILHAGETEGPKSIWSALQVADSQRIGHGVRAVEDAALLAYLREKQVPLEVCPSSNICLNVFPSMAEHSLPRLMEAGLYVTINSDDPPMFNTTLTNEFLNGHKSFGWGQDTIQQLVLNAVNVTLLSEEDRAAMNREFQREFERLNA
jgi:aminodeoxyfutalosine deaminase